VPPGLVEALVLAAAVVPVTALLEVAALAALAAVDVPAASSCCNRLLNRAASWLLLALELLPV
jgi:hypothetical protein